MLSSYPSKFLAGSCGVNSSKDFAALSGSRSYTSAARLPRSPHPSSFRRWCKNSVIRTGWFTPRPPSAVLRYLGRYTHRVAISNHRIVAHEGDQVTFHWRDYAHGNKQRLMTLSAEEFLRRFVQHVLPRGFVRIRQFGFLANACRTKLIAVGRQLLAFIPDLRAPSTDLSTNHLWKCPHCGAPMHIQEKLSALQLKGRCRFIDTS